MTARRSLTLLKVCSVFFVVLDSQYDYVRLHCMPNDICVRVGTAALVIQGSAFVYSKKVEYLYNLVFQALEYISSHKKHDEAGGGSSARPHSSRSIRNIIGDDDEMKPLDDVIESLYRPTNRFCFFFFFF